MAKEMVKDRYMLAMLRVTRDTDSVVHGEFVDCSGVEEVGKSKEKVLWW